METRREKRWQCLIAIAIAVLFNSATAECQQSVPAVWTLGSVQSRFEAQWSPDGRYVYTVQNVPSNIVNDTILKVWDMERGGEMVRAQRYRGISGNRLRIAPNGALIAIVGDSPATILLVDTQTLQPQGQIPLTHTIQQVSWSPDS